jgi:hypothetical protein
VGLRADPSQGSGRKPAPLDPLTCAIATQRRVENLTVAGVTIWHFASESAVLADSWWISSGC